MLRKISIAIVSSSILVSLQALAAPSILAKEITLDYRRYEVTASPAESKRVVFYALTKGNSSQPFSVTLTAPAGVKPKAAIAGSKGVPAVQAIAGRSFYPIGLRTTGQIAAQNACLKFSPGEGSGEKDDVPPISRPESDSPLCDLFSEAEMAAFAETLSAVYGGPWSRAQVCGYLVENYFGGQEGCDPHDPACVVTTAKTVQATSRTLFTAVERTTLYYGIIHKNACAPKNSKYMVRLEVDLSKIDPVAHPLVHITIQASEFAYAGGKAASIKPQSSGRFAPQPVLLMTFIGTMCGQKLSLAKWKGSTLQSVTALKLGDLVPYKGWILTRSPISRVLTGGRGTFELTSAYAGYGACFELIRRRQKVNGY